MPANLSENSFLPEAVICSRSFARVMPRRRCATRRRYGFAGVNRRASFVEEFHVLGGLGLGEVPSDQ